MRRLLLILMFSSLVSVGCGMPSDGEEPPAGSPRALMYDGVTPLGIKVQSNGFTVDYGRVDVDFRATEQCLGVSQISPDIYLILKEPFKAFPCVVLTNGCGGLFQVEFGVPVITVSADLIRLKHEYIHYMLYVTRGDPDYNHTLPLWGSCS